MRVLNNGAFIVLFDPDETRDVRGKLLNPPQLLLLVYDVETLVATAERISFLAAKTLSREKFEAAMYELAEARRIAREVVAAMAQDGQQSQHFWAEPVRQHKPHHPPEDLAS